MRSIHPGRTANMLWARPGSDFTLLFEALPMALMREMPVKAAARIVSEHDTRLWRVLHHYVDQARKKEDFSRVRKVGVDETSHRRGHDYITVFADLECSKVLFATGGRDSSTIERFNEDLKAHGGAAGQVAEFTMDMSEAYRKGVGEHFEKAEMTIDRHHVVQQLNQAMDEIRRPEQRQSQAINSMVQAAKRHACGYRSKRNYIAMIYMTAGKLNFELPT